MIKIAIHGFYGQGNLGDEVILKALLQEFEKFPNVKVVVFSRDPDQVYKTHGVKSVHSKRGGLGFLGRLFEIKTSDLFILGGGGLLKDYENDSLSIAGWLKLLQFAKRLNVKAALYGVGVENIRYDDSKKLIRDVLDEVNLIMVRDSNSKNILKSIGVKNKIKVTTDPAILLAKVSTEKTRDVSNPPKIMICVRHWFNKGFYIEKPEVNRNFIKSLGIAADFVIEHYQAKIDFIPMRTTYYDNDRIVAEQVVSHMKHKDMARIHLFVPELDEFTEMVNEYSLVIGMRLHSLILATGVGVPVIGLEYMPKVRAYMDSINQGDYSLKLEEVTGDKLIGLVRNTFKQYDTRCETICSEVASLQSIARDSIAQLVELAGMADSGMRSYAG